MNKIVIGVLLLAALAGGWYLFHGATTVDYVASVSDEIDTLETELVALEVAADAGTLTPQKAAEAQAKVAARIEAINTALAQSDKESGLTAAQRKQLLAALTKLKGLFIEYRSVLTVVDETAAELSETERRIYYPKSDGTRVGVTALIAEAIDSVETVAEEVVEDYEPEDTTPEEVTAEEFDAIVEETVEDAIDTEEEPLSDMGSSTEQVVGDAMLIEGVDVEAVSDMEVEGIGDVDVEVIEDTEASFEGDVTVDGEVTVEEEATTN